MMHDIDHRFERLPQRRERVFDLRRHLGIHLAIDQTIAFQLPQLLRQCAMRDTGQRSV